MRRPLRAPPIGNKSLLYMEEWIRIIVIIICLLIILYLVYRFYKTPATKRREITNNILQDFYEASIIYFQEPRQNEVILNNIANRVNEEELEAIQLETLGLALDNLGLLNNPMIFELIPQLEVKVSDKTIDKIAAAETTEEKIATIIEHTNDNQNVHDSAVLSSIETIINRIKQDSTINYDIDIIKKLKEEFMSMESKKVAIVNEVLDTIAKKSLVYQLKMTDYQVLYCIYCRIYHPLNAKNREALLESLFDALYDCYDGTTVVCVTGRISHIISSLATLDFDEQNWQINRSEEYKNEIREMLGKIINDVDNGTSLFINKPNAEYLALESSSKKMHHAYDQLLSCYSADGPKGELIFDKPENTIVLRAPVLKNLREEGRIVIELSN
jgi:hypothetical protein